MLKNKTFTILLAAATVAATAGAAQRVQLLTPQAGDIAPAKVVAPAALLKSAGAPGVPRDAVAVSFAAAGDIDLAIAPHVAKSREYYRQASGAELAAGLEIYTTAPHALVRMNPVGPAGINEKVAIDPMNLVLVGVDGKSYAAGSGMEMLVNADQLAKADTPFVAGTSAFRIAKALGAGTFRLQADHLSAEQLYMINVFEPESAVAMELRTSDDTYLHGDSLRVVTSLENGLKRASFQTLQGMVTSPAGRTFPVTFTANGRDAFRADLALDADEAPMPGLWEVRVEGEAVVDGNPVIRTARTAFDVAAPTARFDGGISLIEADGLGVSFGIEVGAAGRYEVRGILYGHAGGQLVPVAIGHSADWLEAGSGLIELTFSSELLEGVEGPYEVRDLRLMDQGRMGILHQQAHGLVIE